MPNIITKELRPGQWPSQLSDIEPPVRRLFVKGTLNNSSVFLASIGSDTASKEAQTALVLFLRELLTLFATNTSLSLTVISELSSGINNQSLLTSLRYQIPTVAVLPALNGIVIPAENRIIAKTILQKTRKGNAVVAERLSAGTDQIANLDSLDADRIVAGLADAVITGGIADPHDKAMDTIAQAYKIERPICFIAHTVSQAVRELLMGKFEAHELEGITPLVESILTANQFRTPGNRT